MAEPAHTRWQTGRPLTASGLTLLPIEQVRWQVHTGHRGGWVTVTKEPVALVVRDATGCRAIAPDGRALALEALHGRVPGLGAVLAAL